MPNCGQNIQNIEALEKATQCYQGFNCYNPRHILTVLGRYNRELSVMDEFTSVDGVDLTAARKDAQFMSVLIGAALGIGRPMETIKTVLPPNIGKFPGVNPAMLMALGQTPDHRGRFDIPLNIEAKWRLLKFREARVCPHGLACPAPVKAMKRILVLHDITRALAGRANGTNVAHIGALYQYISNLYDLMGFAQKGDETRQKAKDVRP